MSEYPVYRSYLDTPGLFRDVQLAPPPHKPSVWVSSVPQLPGHTRTICGCPTCSPTNLVSEYSVYHSYLDTLGLSLVVQLAPTNLASCNVPGRTGTIPHPNLHPTNRVSEYPVYNSYLDTPGLSWDVQLAPHKPCVSCTTVTWTHWDYCWISNLLHKPSAWVSHIPQLQCTWTHRDYPTCDRLWEYDPYCATVQKKIFTWNWKSNYILPIAVCFRRIAYSVAEL